MRNNKFTAIAFAVAACGGKPEGAEAEFVQALETSPCASGRVVYGTPHQETVEDDPESYYDVGLGLVGIHELPEGILGIAVGARVGDTLPETFLMGGLLAGSPLHQVIVPTTPLTQDLQVFWVEERRPMYVPFFVVTGDPGTTFSWASLTCAQ